MKVNRILAGLMVLILCVMVAGATTISDAVSTFTGGVSVNANGVNVTGYTDLNTGANVDGIAVANNGVSITANGMNVTGKTIITDSTNTETLKVATSNNGASAWAGFFESTTLGANTNWIRFAQGDSHGRTFMASRNLPASNTSDAVATFVNDNPNDDQSVIYSQEDSNATNIYAISTSTSTITNRPVILARHDGKGTNKIQSLLGQIDGSGQGNNFFYRGYATTTEPVVEIWNDNESDTGSGIDIRVDGTGKALEIHNSTGLTAYIMPNGTFYGKGFITFTYKEEDYNKNLKNEMSNPNNILDNEQKLNTATGVYADCRVITQEPIYEERTKDVEYCDENEVCEIIQEKYLFQTGTEQKIGKDMDCVNTKNALIISELVEENNLMKSELCKKDITYAWCK